MEEGLRTVLQANKREMFDGMRAYHESEIKHTNHAITILLSITGAANAASVAILSKGGAMGSAGSAAALGPFGVVGIFSFAIGYTTHLKIGDDNRVYRRYGEEYYRTSKALQLMDGILAENSVVVVKPDRPVGQGDGYRRTQHIVWTFAFLSCLVTAMFSALVLFTSA